MTQPQRCKQRTNAVKHYRARHPAHVRFNHVRIRPKHRTRNNPASQMGRGPPRRSRRYRALLHVSRSRAPIPRRPQTKPSPPPEPSSTKGAPPSTQSRLRSKSSKTIPSSTPDAAPSSPPTAPIKWTPPSWTVQPSRPEPSPTSSTPAIPSPSLAPSWTNRKT